MSLLIQEPPLQVLPSLAVKVGLNEAIVLQQVHYWLLRSSNVRDGHKWVYNSYSNWNKQFPFWGRNTLIRAFNSLERQGYLISANYNKAKFDKTKWYRIDYRKLEGKRSTQNGYTRDPEWVDGDTQNGQTNTKRLLQRLTTNIVHRQALHRLFHNSKMSLKWFGRSIRTRRGKSKPLTTTKHGGRLQQSILMNIY